MKRGSALVEFVILLTVFTVFVSTLLRIASWSRRRLQALEVSYFGATLQSLGRISSQTIEREIHEYVRSLSATTERNWSIKRGRFLSTPASRFYRLERVEVIYEHLLRHRAWWDTRVHEITVIQRRSNP